MAKRYFKATNGTMTVFRSSATRVYGSARVNPEIGFSGNGRSNAYPLDAVEINKDEYEALVGLKAQRIDRKKDEIEAEGGKAYRGFGASPQDSWVLNSAIPDGEG